MEPALLDVARTVTATVLKGRAVIAAVDRLPATGGAVVLRVTLSDSRRLVLKVADASDGSVDFERTSAAIALARAAGVPAPAVLAAGRTGHAGWRYLLLEHLTGLTWEQVRPRLGPSQITAADEQIANAVLSMQSVRFASFGELDRQGGPAGLSLLDALHRRAELRVVDNRARETFRRLLDKKADLFAGPQSPTLCHDDLHHGNLLFEERQGHWELAGVLDWDKTWAGPAESDIARMEFWDDMTGPAFWAAYRAAVPAADGYRERASIYQLLWCLEFPSNSARHAADTVALQRRLGLTDTA